MKEDTSRPNILFVFTDQHRASALGCAGVEDVMTPHMDRLASQGTRFTNAVSNTPVCSVARASLLTGRHVLSHELVTNDLPLRTDIPHVAQCLNTVGYRCGYIGKWHVDESDRGVFIPPGPRRRGFDDIWAVANCTHAYNDAFYYWADEQRPYWHHGYEPLSQADMAAAYLRQRGRTPSEPFCLFVSLGTPHCPYGTAPAEVEALYAGKPFRLLPNVPDNVAVDRAGEQWGMHPPRASARDIIGHYYAHITATDAALGRILSALAESGLEENTIVVFTSDHGDMLFSHAHGWKAKPWRESVGIPLLVRYPGQVPANRTSDAPIGLVDMMPTLLGFVGAPIPDGVEGIDLTALMRGDESAAPTDQWINFPCMPHGHSLPEWRGVVTRSHTYVRLRERPFLLYDDRDDPFQLVNLVDSPRSAPLCEELDARVQNWLARTHDPFATSREVADRYAPGHKRNVVPYGFNATVKEELKHPARRRYRDVSCMT